MPSFDVSFLNPKLRSSGGGGDGISVLLNQITILENDLKKDGYLAPSDYDLLIEKTRNVFNNPGLTKTQRSQVEVKLSQLETQKKGSEYDRAEDIDSMNDTIKNEGFEDIMVVGNNPQEFLNGRIASLQAKAGQLQEDISRRENAGQDISEYMNEYNETIRELQNRFGALEGLTNSSGNQVSGYAAFVKTNSRGEIIDIDYNVAGAKSGYVETDGMINGFQIFAKPNAKENGKNIFKLGNETFSAVDMVIPDPLNPGAYTTQALKAESRQTGGAFKRAPSGLMNIPAETLQVQSYIPRDSWAKSADGTLYYRQESGGYQKYLNANTEDLPNFDENRVISIPKQYEQGILRNVTETIDASEPIVPDTGVDLTTPQAGGALPSSVPTASPLMTPFADQAQRAAATVRTSGGQPTERAPQGFFQNAANTFRSAKDYVTNLFR